MCSLLSPITFINLNYFGSKSVFTRNIKIDDCLLRQNADSTKPMNPTHLKCLACKFCRGTNYNEGKSKLLDYQALIQCFISSTLRSLAIRSISLALSSVIYSQIAPFFALNRIFFPANEKGSLKQHDQTGFKSCLK